MFFFKLIQKSFTFIVMGLFAAFIFIKPSAAVHPPKFHATISDIPASIIQRMQPSIWRPGCPVALKDLSYIHLRYWGFDQKAHWGELIVHKTLAKEVVDIFEQLYQQRFPIERMELMERYHGNDEASMAVNNTSSFNCRAKTLAPNVFSMHSYGRAIDINPKLNPYVKENFVAPANAYAYRNRTIQQAGMINPNDNITKLFIRNGWAWGGTWQTRQDYQHFEKL